MKKNMDIDTEIKSMLDEDTEIPEIVNFKIEETYLKLRELDKNKICKKNKVKKIIASTVATIGVICGIGIYNPSIASSIPLVHNIFTDLNEKFNIGNKNAKDIESVQKVSSSNGIKVSIEEAIFDGVNLYLTMELKSETNSPLPIEDRSLYDDKNVYDDKYTYGFHNEIISENFDGEIYSSTDIVGYFKDDKTFIGVTHYVLDLKEDFLDSLDLKLNIDSIGYIDINHPEEYVKGNWDFNFKVNSTDNIKIIKTDLENKKYKINEIRVSPYGVVVDYEMPCDYVNIKNGLTRISVYDDKGNELGGREYSLRHDKYRNPNEIISDKLYINVDMQNYVDLTNSEYFIVKFEDGKHVILDDSVNISENGDTIEGTSYTSVLDNTTEDVAFKIDINDN